MDYRKMYADYVRSEIAKNANPYPTGVQGFQGGILAERQRIIALLDNECFCDSINPYHQKSCDACQYVELIKGENE